MMASGNRLKNCRNESLARPLFRTAAPRAGIDVRCLPGAGGAGGDALLTPRRKSSGWCRPAGSKPGSCRTLPCR